MSNQPPASNHRTITGLVTKLVGDAGTYGFINEEIFFPQTNVSGGPASVGDQVFAECEYSAHLPIKWNATSVKILNRAGGQHQQQNPPRSDQQQQQQSELMNQQQQFNQAGGVAVTYQQHRQQRQQRQMLDVKQPDNNAKQQSNDLTTKLLEHTNNPSGEYFDPGQSRLFPQQMEGNIQPFHDQPMGPPNFTYTSQLGSAFVQNQFVPTPFIAQQPPPLLPQQQPPPPQQQQQQPPPQHLLPNNNQSMHNQNNQRHNKNMGGGGRFNNQGEKNERQNNRRNQNRNDNNKFDRPRSGDRGDGGSHNNNRQQKSNGGRDRSAGRNNRRDDPPARPSPPAHSSARSTTSMSSDRGTKSRRHYEVQNIPKSRVLTNMNAYNMKQRCPSSVHVPSDLKDIIVNKYFRLDIKNTPKPIRYTIEQVKSEVIVEEEKTEPEQVEDEQAKKEGEIETMDIDKTAELTDKATEEESSKEMQPIEKLDVKIQEQPTPPSSKSDIRLNHKYGVKVILLSLPDLETIYHSVFGQNLDSFNLDSKPTCSRLDETISLLCSRSQHSGHSLIGGKFDPIVDGFIEEQTNEFERHGRQPDLIATCKRVVQEQTGLDLANCRSWTLLSTFIYNNKSDYFSPKASIEYSFIYMPQIWTMLSENFDKNIKVEETPEPQAELPQTTDSTVEELVESSKATAMEAEESDSKPVIEPEDGTDKDDSNNPSSSTPNEIVAPINPENLAELKVSDLKAELDKRDIKYKTGAKKADLIALLHESMQQTQASNVDADDLKTKEEDSTTPAPSTVVAEQTQPPQLEEGEVEAEHSEDSADAECDATSEVASKNKRKGSEADVEGEPESKKACTGSPVKVKRIELIQEAFKVRARDDQQQLSLVSLYEAALASRHDQFELSVASNILKESLVQHLSEYILTTLVEDNKQKLSSNAANQTSSSSQETNSDTNNNNSTTKSTFKNPTSSDTKVNLKEYQVDRYINLAFSYFDSTHMGYVYFEDLNKLFNNTGLTISKRALLFLVGDGEKFNYRTLSELSPKLPPTYVYEFPQQFNVLPLTTGSSSSADGEKNLTTGSNMVEYKGVMYDVAQLVQQVREAETLRVSMVDRFNYAIENSDRQAEEIHVLEVSQKSLSKAIKVQNDEICDLKRERDSFKKKLDSLRKSIKGAVGSLTDILKDEN